VFCLKVVQFTYDMLVTDTGHKTMHKIAGNADVTESVASAWWRLPDLGRFLKRGESRRRLAPAPSFRLGIAKSEGPPEEAPAAPRARKSRVHSIDEPRASNLNVPGPDRFEFSLAARFRNGARKAGHALAYFRKPSMATGVACPTALLEQPGSAVQLCSAEVADPDAAEGSTGKFPSMPADLHMYSPELAAHAADIRVFVRVEPTRPVLEMHVPEPPSACSDQAIRGYSPLPIELAREVLEACDSRTIRGRSPQPIVF
jgi:hypothetical protein